MHAVLVVSEQVDVLGGAAEDTMREQRTPAGQRERVRGHCAQRDGGHLAVQLV